MPTFIPVNGNPFAAGPGAGRTDAQTLVNQQLGTRQLIDNFAPGLGDMLAVGKHAVTAFFPQLAPYLPNQDTGHQVIRQATGNLSDAALAAGAAGGQAIRNALHPNTTNPSPGDTYDAVRAAANNQTQQYKGAVNTAAGIAGGLLPLAAGAAAAPVKVAEAAQLARGAGLGARLAAAAPRLAKATAVSAGVGGAVGGASAPTWQQAPGDALTGAAIGTAAVPVMGVLGSPVAAGAARIAGKAVRGTMHAADHALFGTPDGLADADLKAVAPQAMSKVQGILARNGITTEDLANAPGVDRGLTAAEVVGPDAEQYVTTLARTPGGIGGQAKSQLMERNAGALQRFTGDIHAATGISPEDAFSHVPTTVASEQARVKPLFDQALGVQGPIWNVDLANLAQRPVIQDSIGAAVNSMKNAGLDPLSPGMMIDPDTGAQVTGEDLKSLTELQPTAKAWDLVRKKTQSLVQLDQNGQPITSGKLGEFNKNLDIAGRDLTGALRTAIPGYGEALDESAPYLQLRDTHAASGNVLNANVSAPDFASRFAQMTPAEQEGARYGIAAQLYRRMQNGGSPSTLFQGFGGGDKESVVDKLATAFGPKAAQDLSTAAGLEGQLNESANRMAPNRNSVSSNALMGGDPDDAAAQSFQMSMRQGRPMRAVTGLITSQFAPKEMPGATAVKAATGQLLLLSPPRLAAMIDALPGQQSMMSVDGAPYTIPAGAGLLDQAQDQNQPPQQ